MFGGWPNVGLTINIRWIWNNTPKKWLPSGRTLQALFFGEVPAPLRKSLALKIVYKKKRN